MEYEYIIKVGDKYVRIVGTQSQTSVLEKSRLFATYFDSYEDALFWAEEDYYGDFEIIKVKEEE